MPGHHVPHRIRLFEKTKELPKESWGYLYDPAANSFKSVSFKTEEVMMASSDLAKLKRDVQSGKLVFYRSGVRRVTHYLDPKDLRDEDLVELESTRPEPFLVPLIQPGGFVNGSWRFFRGQRIAGGWFVAEEGWQTYIRWWEEPPPRIGEPMPE